MSYTKPQYKEQFENFIGGELVAPLSGEYFDNISPVDGEILTRIPRSNEADVDAAVAAGMLAFESFKHSSVIERSTMLNKIADAIEANLENLAIAETLDNGKAVRETINADLEAINNAIAKKDTLQKLPLITTIITKEEVFKHYLEIQGSVKTKQNILFSLIFMRVQLRPRG